MNAIKVNEKLKYLNVLRQSLPVIRDLIESGSNFEVVLDLIHNANELIDNKLSALSITKYLCPNSSLIGSTSRTLGTLLSVAGRGLIMNVWALLTATLLTR
jgi:hypothetical protein